MSRPRKCDTLISSDSKSPSQPEQAHLLGGGRRRVGSGFFREDLGYIRGVTRLRDMSYFTKRPHNIPLYIVLTLTCIPVEVKSGLEALRRSGWNQVHRTPARAQQVFLRQPRADTPNSIVRALHIFTQRPP